MTKILVIRFSSLGDVVLTLPLYQLLKQNRRDCSISVAVKRKYASILEKCPDVDSLFILEERESLISLIRRVRSEKFDILIDCHNNLRSNLLSFFSGVPKKVRYKKDIWARRLFIRRKVQSPELKRHVVQRYIDTVRSIGIEVPEKFSPEFHLDLTQTHASLKLRFLVVQTAFLGDAVLTTPLFSALRQSFRDSKISLLCTPEIQSIFTGNRDIDQIFVLDKRGEESGLFSLIFWAKKLKGQFDIALLPHRSFRSAFLVWLARIPKRIGFENSGGRLFLTDPVPFDWKMHDSSRNLRLLEALGIQPSQSPLRVPIEEGIFNFKQFCEKNQIPTDKILVGMNPGSVWKTKRWLPEYFAKVADSLIKETQCQVLIFGSNPDAPSVREVLSHMKYSASNLCGKTDLQGLTVLISQCALLITNDSGPMHLASATHVPLVAVFGPTTRELGFFPLGEKSVVVELDLPCRPCSLHGGDRCPLGHFKCMKDLQPEVVLKHCRSLLGLQ